MEGGDLPMKLKGRLGEGEVHGVAGELLADEGSVGLLEVGGGDLD